MSQAAQNYEPAVAELNVPKLSDRPPGKSKKP